MDPKESAGRAAAARVEPGMTLALVQAAPFAG